MIRSCPKENGLKLSSTCTNNFFSEEMTINYICIGHTIFKNKILLCIQTPWLTTTTSWTKIEDLVRWAYTTFSMMIQPWLCKQEFS